MKLLCVERFLEKCRFAMKLIIWQSQAIYMVIEKVEEMGAMIKIYIYNCKEMYSTNN